jgi:hypothetical protein
LIFQRWIAIGKVIEQRERFPQKLAARAGRLVFGVNQTQQAQSC